MDVLALLRPAPVEDSKTHTLKTLNTRPSFRKTNLANLSTCRSSRILEFLTTSSFQRELADRLRLFQPSLSSIMVAAVDGVIKLTYQHLVMEQHKSVIDYTHIAIRATASKSMVVL